MKALIPTTIERHGTSLLIRWGDGLCGAISLETLRQNCPCAYCKGEQVFGTTVSVPLVQYVPGMYELIELQPVGNYGLRAVWADGHDTGIYTWQLLRSIAQRARSDDNPHAENRP